MLKAWVNGSRMLPPWLALAILLGLQAGLAAFPAQHPFQQCGGHLFPGGRPHHPAA
jgi:hypothetical protein